MVKMKREYKFWRYNTLIIRSNFNLGKTQTKPNHESVTATSIPDKK